MSIIVIMSLFFSDLIVLINVIGFAIYALIVDG